MSAERRGTHHERWLLLAPTISAAIAASVYVVTLQREVGWWDAAELSLQAHLVGTTHPPGYPVHTLLGKAIGLLVADPGLATNLLSACCGALAVGVTSLLVLRLTGHVAASLLAPLTMAFAAPIWTNSTTTESYSVNLLLFALTVLFLVQWHARQTRAALIWSALLFGLSLGSSLANLLMLPAFLFLIGRSDERRVMRFATFLTVVAGTGALMLGFTIVRGQSHPPLGTEFIPGSLLSTLRYFTAHQYGSVALHEPGFYLLRMMEHGAIITSAFLWGGVLLVVIGLIELRRRDPRLALFCVLLLTIDLGYFTTYRVQDYFFMVAPAYLVASVLIAYASITPSRLRHTAPAVMAFICAAQVALNLPVRVERHRQRPVTGYVLRAMESFPANAVVICRWKILTPLLFFQATRNLRPDLTIIERSTEPRTYPHGKIESYLDFAAANAASRPVVIDALEPVAAERFHARAIDEDWLLLLPRTSAHGP